MIINKLNNTELEKINKLFYINNQNQVVSDLFMEYLLNSKELLKTYNKNISFFENLKKMLYIDNNFLNDFKDYDLENKFIELDDFQYTNNDYFKNIHLKNIKDGKYEFKEESINPYEGFIYKPIEADTKYRELTYIGYFKNSYNYLTLQENNSIWMLISPHEINTMEQPIKNAFGNVITFGLGLGYFAYMVSNKENVNSVTIIEKDENIISLFKKHILPQFENKKKITIINEDALKFIDNKSFNYDYAFIDLYRDTDDGLPLYIKMYQKSLNHPNCIFDYWIEESMIFMIRRCILILLYETFNNLYDPSINESYYDFLINKINEILIDYSINSLKDINNLLSIKNIKNIITKI